MSGMQKRIQKKRIELTTDAGQKEKLRRKLEEYRLRYEYQAPEVDPIATYKHRLLRSLLDNGLVDIGLERARYAHLDWHDDRGFDEAVTIIDKYNDNDLSRITGGTGLH